MRDEPPAAFGGQRPCPPRRRVLQMLENWSRRASGCEWPITRNVYLVATFALNCWAALFLHRFFDVCKHLESEQKGRCHKGNHTTGPPIVRIAAKRPSFEYGDPRDPFTRHDGQRPLRIRRAGGVRDAPRNQLHRLPSTGSTYLEGREQHVQDGCHRQRQQGDGL